MITRLAAVREVIPGEEGGLMSGDTLEQYLWWAVLPGMNWRTRSTWPPAQLANAICAEACTVRLIEITGQTSRTQKFFSDRRIRTFLDEAEDDDQAAFHRRFTLCLVMNIAGSKTEPEHLVNYAKTLLGL